MPLLPAETGRQEGIHQFACKGAPNHAGVEHDDMNVLVLGARVTGIETALDCLSAFLSTPFEGGHHSRRVDKMG